MIASNLSSPVFNVVTPDVVEALWAPAAEAASWLDSPPLPLLALVVLTAVLLVWAPVRSPQGNVA